MSTRTDHGLIAIVSGLGPLAGSDVLAKLLEHSAERYGAVEDAEYPDVVLYSHGIDTFDETGSVGDAVERELVATVRRLELDRPTVMGIACNTAHLYLPHLRSHTLADVVDLIEEVALAAARRDARYLLLSSSTTRRTGLYHQRLIAHGVQFTEVDAVQQRTIDEVVHLVMGRRLYAAAERLERFLDALDPTSFDAIIAGCTELPLAVDVAALRPSLAVIDSNRVLAEALADRYYAGRAIHPRPLQMAG